jgi:thermitase
VLDTGIDEEHEDLAGQIAGRANFTGSDTTNDIYGHGTHIAGIIAAKNNGRGITGVAYNCRLLNVKVADDGGWLDEQALANGIRWAADRGARVINVSLYTFKQNKDVEEAMDYAWSKGSLIVGCSGNGTGDKTVYPASYSTCLAAGATNSDNIIPAWSGTGKWVNIAAPGADILSTVPGNRYERKSGTSMAAAYVSGLAGLLFSLLPEQPDGPAQNKLIGSIIRKSCTQKDGDGTGRINALNAVQLLMSTQAGSRATADRANP